MVMHVRMVFASFRSTPSRFAGVVIAHRREVRHLRFHGRSARTPGTLELDAIP